MSKSVWSLSLEDKNEIQSLYEKKLALENLIKIIDVDNAKMYDKLMTDYGATMKLFQEWWATNSLKHKWEGKIWHIDFVASEVIASDI